jgi:hypothetical protein
MLFKETIAVYSEDYRKQNNTDLFTVKVETSCSYH